MRTAKWLEAAMKEYRTFPADVQDAMGFHVERAQDGKKGAEREAATGIHPRCV